MKFEDAMKQKVELYPIGGQTVTIEDLVKEVQMRRRDIFLHRLFSTEAGNRHCVGLFDAIGFLAATANHQVYYDCDGDNREGTITYDVIAGGDWVWHCTTTISWVDTYPIVYGALKYETTIENNENVDNNRIYALNGTSLEIKVIQKNIKTISRLDALERTRRNNCK